MTFLYQVAEGRARASHGLNVARMAGLPQLALDRAVAKAKQLRRLGKAEAEAKAEGGAEGDAEGGAEDGADGGSEDGAEGEAEGEAEGGAFELVRRACRLARKRDAGESTGGPEKGANSSACSEEVRVLVAGLVAAQAACT